MGEIADMGTRAFDDFAVGVDQRVGLTRQRRDLDGKIAFQPFGRPERMSAIGGDALQRRQRRNGPGRGSEQHDTERHEGVDR